MLRCDVITLFPDLVEPVLGLSMLKRVPEKRLLVATCDIDRVHAESVSNLQEPARC